ncbi:MAG: hydrogenase maturation nickel metallochaperone HypA [Nocardioidaceae bacterium]|nr:hydrogenase maturation nickel metallochaperone HypA [Nocardioidaceae bacterium]
MHELSITQSVVDTVLERTQGRRVTTVRRQVGALSGVVADAMRFCFDLVTSGTALEGGGLEIDKVTEWHSVGTAVDQFALSDLILPCPRGSADVSVESGRELRPYLTPDTATPGSWATCVSASI